MGCWEDYAGAPEEWHNQEAMVNDLAVETRGGRCTERSKKQRACGQWEEDLRGQLCCKGRVNLRMSCLVVKRLQE